MSDIRQLHDELVGLDVHENPAAEGNAADPGFADAVAHPPRQDRFRKPLQSPRNPVESLALEQAPEEVIGTIGLWASLVSHPSQRHRRIEPHQLDESLEHLINTLWLRIRSQPHQFILMLEGHHTHQVGHHRIDISNGVLHWNRMQSFKLSLTTHTDRGTDAVS